MKDRHTLATNIDGYYLECFTMEGKKLWNYVSDENDQLYEDNYLRKKIMSYLRSTMARRLDNGGICLQIASPEKIYTYEFNEEGNVTKTFNNNFENAVQYDSFFLTFDNSEICKYLTDNYSKRKSFYGYSSTSGDVLVAGQEGKQITFSQWLR